MGLKADFINIWSLKCTHSIILSSFHWFKNQYITTLFQRRQVKYLCNVLSKSTWCVLSASFIIFVQSGKDFFTLSPGPGWLNYQHFLLHVSSPSWNVRLHTRVSALYICQGEQKLTSVCLIMKNLFKQNLTRKFGACRSYWRGHLFGRLWEKYILRIWLLILQFQKVTKR